ISIAIGHEVAVTALQVAMAYGAIANGGYLMKPFVVKEIRDREGKIVQQYYPQRIRRVMDREVANTMAKILERVVDKGTGRLAKIPGYRIAGKTGTAQKPLKDRPGYSNSKFIASFCGFFPVDQPRFLIFVMIDEPHPAHSGGHVAAPTFKKILERILKIYEIPPQQYTSVEETHIGENDKFYVPNLVGRRYDVAVQILDELGLNYQLEGEGLLVMKQEFHSDSETPQVVLTMARKMDDEEKVTVPDVRGLSVRKAVSILSFRGLRVHLNGSGRVVKQSLDPGLQVRPGTHIWIACESTGDLPVEIRVTN
ncbi:MAG: PASTA domain-containing protein, partial [Calditrichaeota bacterium]